MLSHDFLHVHWATDKINELRQNVTAQGEASRHGRITAWGTNVLRDLLRDESERRAIGGGPDWKARHAKSWEAAFGLSRRSR